jgi:hypothetical protein
MSGGPGEKQNRNMFADQVSGSIWNPAGIEPTTARVHGLCNRIEMGKRPVGSEMVLSRTWQVILEVAYVLLNRSDVLLKRV